MRTISYVVGAESPAAVAVDPQRVGAFVEKKVAQALEASSAEAGQLFGLAHKKTSRFQRAKAFLRVRNTGLMM